MFGELGYIGLLSKLIHEIVFQVDNRQIATLIVISSLIAFTVFSKGPKKIFRMTLPVIEAVQKKAIIMPALLIIAYSCFVFSFAYSFSLWQISIVLDVIIEIVFVGLPLAMTVACKYRTIRAILINTFVPQLELSALIGFYMGIQPFSLGAELMIQYALLIIGIYLYRCEKDKSERIQVILGLVLIGATSGCLFIGRDAIDWILEIQSFLMTLWYPILMLPIIVLLAYFAAYQALCFRLSLSRETGGALSRILICAALFPSLISISTFSMYEACELRSKSTLFDRMRYIFAIRSNNRRRVLEERAKDKLRRRNLNKAGYIDGGIWGDFSSLEDIKSGLNSVKCLQSLNYEKTGKNGVNLESQLDFYTPSNCTYRFCKIPNCGSVAFWMTNATGFTFGVAMLDDGFTFLAYEGDREPEIVDGDYFCQFKQWNDDSLINWRYLFKVSESFL